jgi:small subunit ribosomal protein S3Ae
MMIKQPIFFSVIRARNSQKTLLRRIINQIVEEKAKNLNFDQFVQEAVLGKIASDIYNEAKKIIPIRHIGMRKSKLLAYPGEKLEKKESLFLVEHLIKHPVKFAKGHEPSVTDNHLSPRL